MLGIPNDTLSMLYPLSDVSKVNGKLVAVPDDRSPANGLVEIAQSILVTGFPGRSHRATVAPVTVEFNPSVNESDNAWLEETPNPLVA